MSTQNNSVSNEISKENLIIHRIDNPDEFPSWINREQLAEFLYESLKPYEDTVEDIQKSLDYVFSDSEGKGGSVSYTHLTLPTN